MKHVLISTLAVLALACGTSREEPPPAAEEPSSGEEHETPQESEAPSGRTCGGIGAIRCPAEHWCHNWCHITAQHPDATGTCRPNGECDAPSDCERQELVHAMCVGAWACRDPSGGETPPDPPVLRDPSLRSAPLGAREGSCAWECS